MPRRLLLLLFAALVVAACSSDDPADDSNGPGPDPDPDPDPQFEIDVVRFRVWTIESPTIEKLRWVGTWEGPLPESPEQTRWPWIGYGRPFRVDWKAFSKDLPIESIEYRVSQDTFGPWLSAGGSSADFDFANSTDAGLLVGESCPEGEDCVGQLRFNSGRHRIEVMATTTGDRVLDEEVGRLEFEVNYPPSIEIVIDPASGPEDPLASPVVSWIKADGTTHRQALVEGDSIPSGASVRFRVRGWDRLASTTETDSFCCDERLDPEVPLTSFHGMAHFSHLEVSRNRLDSLFTFFGPASPDSVLSMDVGPFDYGARFRAKDEHGRPGESDMFSFVAGFPPQPPTVDMLDGGTAFLNPDRAPGPGELAFVVSDPVTLGWDPEFEDWFDDEELPARFLGKWYEIPMALRGAPHPRALDVSTTPPPDASPQSRNYSDHVRSFAYEIIHEDDPDNDIQQGIGDGANFRIDADELGVLDLTGDRAWRIFIPDLLFQTPEFFDPDGSCDNPDLCAIGARLIEQLGDFDVRFRSHTTVAGSVFHQEWPMAARDQVVDLQRHGRFSDWVDLSCTLKVAFTDGAGQVIDLWPRDTP